MQFTDRTQAGVALCDQLGAFANASDVVVVAIPRGGVVVGYEIARTLHVPLDVIVTKKIGAPGNPEYAIGSVDMTGHVLLNDEVLRSLGISPAGLQEEVQRLQLFIQEKVKRFRGTLKPVNLQGRRVILVDDGVATGYTMQAAVQSLRAHNVASVTIALPVGAEDAVHSLQPLVNEMVVLYVPEFFQSVSQFYQEFGQIDDAHVHDLLQHMHDVLDK